MSQTCLSASLYLSFSLSIGLFAGRPQNLRTVDDVIDFMWGSGSVWHTNVAACCLRHVYSQTLCLPIKVFCDKRTLVTVGQ